MLVLTLNFIKKLETVYVRPFPQLGTLLTYFSHEIFPTFEPQLSGLTTGAHQFLSKLLSDYYGGHGTQNVSLVDLYAWGSFEENAVNNNL